MENKLERFLMAQNNRLGVGYSQALEEVKNGKKEGHWIWYIFPQLKRLGTSRKGIFFGIWNREEAIFYLNHPILGERLREISGELLKNKELQPDQIFGERDALKVQSCMTLFDDISPDDVFAKVLDAFYGGEKCLDTMAFLDREKNPVVDGPYVYDKVEEIDKVVEENFLDEAFEVLLDKDDYFTFRGYVRHMKAIALSANYFSDKMISLVKDALGRFEKKDVVGTMVYIVNSGKDNKSLVPVSILDLQKFFKMLVSECGNGKFGIDKNMQTKYAPETKVTITIIVGYC